MTSLDITSLRNQWPIVCLFFAGTDGGTACRVLPECSYVPISTKLRRNSRGLVDYGQSRVIRRSDKDLFVPISSGGGYWTRSSINKADKAVAVAMAVVVIDVL
jgi:hypothetical protein